MSETETEVVAAKTAPATEKKSKVISKPKTAAKAKPAKAVIARPAKPSIPLHSLKMVGYGGPSGVTNTRPTKTLIDYSKFGSRQSDAMTDRDRKSLSALRAGFEKREFTRANLDAGVIRRLGSMGFLAHVSGAGNAPDALFKLTPKAFTKEAA